MRRRRRKRRKMMRRRRRRTRRKMRTRSLPDLTSLATARATREPKTLLAELAELEVLATLNLRLRQVSRKSTVADEERPVESSDNPNGCQSFSA